MGNNIIVAVDLGATKIAIAAAERKNNGSIKVLALESEPINKGTFSNGLINRPYDVKGALIKTKQLLNNRLDTLRLNVSSIYTSIGGRSLRSELKDHSKSFDHDTEISQEILERMQEEVYRNNHYKKDVLYIVNQGYTVDGDYKVNPVGNFCLSIIGHYLVVLGNSIIEEGIEKISQQLDVNIEGMQISPICVAKAILTDNDKQKGCCVIDFGASKTGMALYHEGYLKHVAIIPFGSQHVTKDITHLGLKWEEAEKLKCSKGSAITTKESPQESYKLSSLKEGGDFRVVKASDLTRVIQMRMEEILYLVWQEVKKMGLEDQLQAGIVITGGGSKLNRLDELITLKTKQVVRDGSALQNLNPDAPSAMFNASYTQLVGQLMDGTVNCTVNKVKEDATGDAKHNQTGGKKKGRNIFGDWLTKTGNIFNDGTAIEE